MAPPYLEHLVVLVMESHPALLAALVFLAILKAVVERDDPVVYERHEPTEKAKFFSKGNIPPSFFAPGILPMKSALDSSL